MRCGRRAGWRGSGCRRVIWAMMSGVAVAHRWVWQSIRPGSSVAPAPSMTESPGSWPIAWIESIMDRHVGVDRAAGRRVEHPGTDDRDHASSSSPRWSSITAAMRAGSRLRSARSVSSWMCTVCVVVGVLLVEAVEQDRQLLHDFVGVTGEPWAAGGAGDLVVEKVVGAYPLRRFAARGRQQRDRRRPGRGSSPRSPDVPRGGPAPARPAGGPRSARPGWRGGRPGTGPAPRSAR